MRFIAFSDFHGNEYNYENAKTTVNDILKSKDLDFIVICGDLTTREGPDEASNLIKLADFPVETYFVFGNMDYFNRINQNLDIATNLHLNPVRIGNYDIIGIGGNNNEISMAIKSAKDIIKNIKPEFLILITHVAPYMYCDIAYDGRHIGSKHLSELIKEFQKEIKMLVCCGHVHEQWTCNNKLGNAIIWNVGPKGILFDITNSKINTQIL
ncbi:MAG: metallophosphoesterase family protein [Candidatus Helarchaeota archaeon]